MVNAPDKLRVMVDATVLIAGSGWPRWPREVLLAGLRGEIQLVLCRYVINQARRNLTERFPEFLQRFEDLILRMPLELVPDPTPEEIDCHKGLVRDESDLPVALAAIAAGVDCLVSEDKDLTARDETTAQFRERLTVLLSGTFLRQIMGWSGEDLERLRKRTWQDISGEHCSI